MLRNIAKFIVFVLISLITIVACMVVPEAKSQGVMYNKFENMVNATVLLRYPDNGNFASGVFFKDNVVLTAAHCLLDENGKPESKVLIELIDGTVLESSDVYIDEEEDVGFIFVDANELSIPNVSDRPMKLGDDIYIVGTPHTLDNRFTLIHGIVSSFNRNNQSLNWRDMIQTDTDGGAGMSGGPLYNVCGELIGMYNGQLGMGGFGINFCEDIESILTAYERCEKKKSGQ